ARSEDEAKAFKATARPGANGLEPARATATVRAGDVAKAEVTSIEKPGVPDAKQEPITATAKAFVDAARAAVQVIATAKAAVAEGVGRKLREPRVNNVAVVKRVRP